MAAQKVVSKVDPLVACSVGARAGQKEDAKADLWAFCLADAMAAY